MPTTFNVFQLGFLPAFDMDTTEGNNTAENAAALVGSTFGGPGDALLNSAAELTPGTGGFGGGTSTAYDQDNDPAENFRINGGANQVFDSAAIFNATITFIDGSTATVTAVIFQDTAGNTYFAPEFSANPDQAALQADAIQSLTLDSLSGNVFSGLSGNRQTWDFVTCYVAGTAVRTPAGDTAIEQLRVGDFVMTQDHGAQAIRWIGQSTVLAKGHLAPVRIAAGALGQNIPSRDLLVSRQHRMLVASRVCERMFGETEILVPAIKLTSLPGIHIEERDTSVTYYHLMTDAHEVIFAEDAPSETLLTGPNAMEALSSEALAELEAIFPDVLTQTPVPARQIHRNKRVETLLSRHQRNKIPVLCDAP